MRLLSFVFSLSVLLAGTHAVASPYRSHLSPTKLSVLTFNAWLLELPFGFGSRDTAARLAAMPEKIAATNADIIAFQEVWSQRHKDALIMGLKKYGYGYFSYELIEPTFWMRGLFGNGLLIVSKFPLESPSQKEQRVLTFKDYTRTEEYFAAKGALHTQVQIPGWGKLHFYNTHFGAVSFSAEGRRFSLSHESRRQLQARQLFDFIKQTSKGNPTLVLGDFNAHYSIYREHAFSEDPTEDYARLVCSSPQENCLNLRDVLSAQDKKNQVTTVDPSKNGYIGRSRFYKNLPPLRSIDYIFVTNTKKITTLESKVVLTENHQIELRSEVLPLSDHYGLMSWLELH